MVGTAVQVREVPSGSQCGTQWIIWNCQLTQVTEVPTSQLPSQHLRDSSVRETPAAFVSIPGLCTVPLKVGEDDPCSEDWDGG